VIQRPHGDSAPRELWPLPILGTPLITSASMVGCSY